MRAEAVTLIATLWRMSWILPTPLLLFAGVVAMSPLVSVVRRPTSLRRIAEAFVTTLAVIAFVGLALIKLRHARAGD